MTPGEWLGLSDTRERWLTRFLQALLVGVAAFGLATANWGVAIPAVIAVGVTLLPALFRREYGYTMAPSLVLWIAVAMVLHAAGTLGLYSTFQWYDEIAHTTSATLIAGIGYASFRALELHSDEIDVPPAFRALFVVVFVLATGMIWEVMEYAAGGLVTVYGVDDIVTDFVFNGLGALVVALWGTRYADGLVGFLRKRLRAA